VPGPPYHEAMPDIDKSRHHDPECGSRLVNVRYHLRRPNVFIEKRYYTKTCLELPRPESRLPGHHTPGIIPICPGGDGYRPLYSFVLQRERRARILVMRFLGSGMAARI